VFIIKERRKPFGKVKAAERKTGYVPRHSDVAEDTAESIIKIFRKPLERPGRPAPNFLFSGFFALIVVN
jgi:hypothetical protein